MINEATDFYLEYSNRKLTVFEKGRARVFRNISQEEYERLKNGLDHNPKSGYRHFNAFLSRNFDKEVGGEFDQEYNNYRREKDNKAYDDDLKKTFPELE